jgi:hypothetical protein
MESVFSFYAEIAACCWALRRINCPDAELWWSYGNLRLDVGLYTGLIFSTELRCCRFFIGSYFWNGVCLYLQWHSYFAFSFALLHFCWWSVVLLQTFSKWICCFYCLGDDRMNESGYTFRDDQTCGIMIYFRLFYSFVGCWTFDSSIYALN